MQYLTYSTRAAQPLKIRSLISRTQKTEKQTTVTVHHQCLLVHTVHTAVPVSFTSRHWGDPVLCVLCSRPAPSGEMPLGDECAQVPPGLPNHTALSTTSATITCSTAAIQPQVPAMPGNTALHLPQSSSHCRRLGPMAVQGAVLARCCMRRPGPARTWPLPLAEGDGAR